MPNVGPYIYDVSISGFTRSSIYIHIYDISSLRVNNEDVEESLEDHKDDLSTEELEHLQRQLQKAIVEEISSEEEEGREDVPTSLNHDIFVQNGVRCKVSWNDITPIKQ